MNALSEQGVLAVQGLAGVQSRSDGPEPNNHLYDVCGHRRGTFARMTPISRER